MQKGDKVKLMDSDIEKQRWGGNHLPSDYLEIGEIYTIDKVEVFSFHTKIYLKEAPGKKFNSTHFEKV